MDIDPVNQNPDPNAPPKFHYTVGTSNQPLSVTKSVGGQDQVYQYTYNPLGGITKVVDPLGRTFKYIYKSNQIDVAEIRQTKGSNNDLLFKATYNGQHLPLKTWDAAGYETNYTYNVRGQLQTVTNAKNEVTTYNYTAGGYLDNIDGPLAGNLDKTTFIYDPVHPSTDRMTGITRYQGPSSSDQYALALEYDNIDRVTQITYPDGTTEKAVYKYLDFDRTKDRLNRWTSYAFSPMRQLVKERDAAGRTTLYEWCRCGSLQKLTDPLGRVTKWAYDEGARMLSKTYDDTSQELFTYQPGTSRLQTRTDAKGNVTTYDYWIDDRVKSLTFTPGSGSAATAKIDYTYDANYSRMATVGNSTGTGSYGTYTFHYDVPYVSDFSGAGVAGRGKVSSITNDALSSGTVAYQYDELGRVVDRRINGMVNDASRIYDAAGRLASWTNPLGTFTPTYQNAAYGVDRLSSLAIPGGLSTVFDWEDKFGDFRLKEIKHLDPSSAILSKYNYITNAVGNITEWTQQRASAVGEKNGLGYDFADQLTSNVIRNASTNAIVK